jgi:hypothetical protein
MRNLLQLPLLLSLGPPVLWSATAHAESAGTLPKGSEVIYAGLGLTTFAKLDRGNGVEDRDREVRPRLDLYGSLGLTERLQISLSVPVVYSTVIDDPDAQPCGVFYPEPTYCDAYMTLGSARLDSRLALLRKKTKLTAGLAANVDRWNAARRGQFNSAGSGRSNIEPLLVAGTSVDAGKWNIGGLALGAFALSLGEETTSADGSITLRSPPHSIRGSVEVRADAPGPLALELGWHINQRLGGVPMDSAWVDDWFWPSKDRWNVVQYSSQALSGKVSIDLPQNMGVHVGVGRVVAVEYGPPDTTDVSIGWHRYFKP